MQTLEKASWKLFGMGEEEHNELAKLRGKMRLTQTAFAGRLGVSVHKVKNWEYGKTPIPSTVLGKARSLATHDLPSDVKGPDGAASESEVEVPYIGKIAASGKADWDDPLEGDLTQSVPVHMLQRGTFCATVASDSMTPLLQPDDLAIFRRAEHARLGLIVLYRHKDNTVTVKQLKHDGTRPILHPLNPQCEDVSADGMVIGILTGFVRRIGLRKRTDYDPDGLVPDFF